MRKYRQAERTVVPPKKLLSVGVFDLIQKSIPIVCVDLVIIRNIRSNKPEVLLVKRKIYPEAGRWCVIGGRVLKGETLAGAIRRQAKRELGLTVSVIPPWTDHAPLYVFDSPKIKDQKHPITLSYPIAVKGGQLRLFGPEFSHAKWFLIKKLPKNMGFFHREEVIRAEAALNT